MKLIINRCYGGFNVSPKAMRLYAKRTELDSTVDYEQLRDDSELIRIVEELGEEASGRYSKLKVIEIPDDVEYEIHNYDGMESVHEVHRVWQ